MKNALVVGCRGQDGSYLLELLKDQGYTVSGIDQGVVQGALAHSCSGLDIRNSADVRHAVAALLPDEIYYLAAFHHSSEDQLPDDTALIQGSFEINTLALASFLAAIHTVSPRSRLFYAASSHVFGAPTEPVQDENTPLAPLSPYAISKAAGIHLCRYYRSQRNVYCSVGILYNHESPRRSPAFITKRVVAAAVRIKNRKQDKLAVGDLDAVVDWGYAPEYVEAMWKILQLDQPGEYVIATGTLHSVQELITTAFEAVGLDWREHVVVEAGRARRPAAAPLQGNSAKLRRLTGWQPRTEFRRIIQEMIQAEVQNAG